ncbi:MAG TPA: iron uptake transporter permease EfeU [Acidimicrobiales bacterium]
MLQTYLTGLREGLEASLVVGILVAYLVKASRRDQLAAVWLGVSAAVVLSLGVGALLTFTSRSLTFEAQEAFGGFMSIVAVAFVTWMVFWMRAQAHAVKHELHAKMDKAVGMGGFAVALAAFLAVGREGLETALFLWPTIQATGSGVAPVLGAFLGIITAVVVGYLIYRRAISLNLAVFFKITGIALIVIAAGVLAYGVHDLQEAGILPGLNNLAFDVSEQIPPTSWYGTLLKGTLNISPATTWLELATYLGYLIPVLVLFLRPVRLPARAATAAVATPVTTG